MTVSLCQALILHPARHAKSALSSEEAYIPELDHLPYDILHGIAAHLDGEGLARFSTTSKRHWYASLIR